MAGVFDQAVGLHNQGRLVEAEQLYRQVLAAEPHNAIARANLGHVLGGQRRFAQALAAYDQALALDPGLVVLHFIRAETLQSLMRYDEALASYDRFLGHAADQPRGWNGRALALQSLGRLDEALECYAHAEALDPSFAAAHLNRGLCHLLMGDFAAGLPLYEWRKRMPQPMEARIHDAPLWTGAEDIRGKTLFTYVEQGLGDAIQFYRYAALAQARGARVILSAPDRLLALLKHATPAVELIGRDRTPQQFDFHIPLASIPLAVDMRADTIPSSPHYLSAEPQRLTHWKTRLGDRGFRIGIAWQGIETVVGLEGKSFPLATLAGIAAPPDVRLISLQKGNGVEQLEALPAGMTVERYDFDQGSDAFLDTAAMMQACDLVISADSAPAHLAGALGTPVWLALKHVPDWRWFIDRSDSPWYPSMRLFRQPALSDWAGVFAAMARELTSRRS